MFASARWCHRTRKHCEVHCAQQMLLIIRIHRHIPFTTVTPQHILCVLVPYRDRAAELQTFAPYIDAFLERQQVEHKIIILNQTDELRFNRASLINVGWYEADRVCISNNSMCQLSRCERDFKTGCLDIEYLEGDVKAFQCSWWYAIRWI